MSYNAYTLQQCLMKLWAQDPSVPLSTRKPEPGTVSLSTISADGGVSLWSSFKVEAPFFPRSFPGPQHLHRLNSIIFCAHSLSLHYSTWRIEKLEKSTMHAPRGIHVQPSMTPPRPYRPMYAAAQRIYSFLSIIAASVLYWLMRSWRYLF